MRLRRSVDRLVFYSIDSASSASPKPVFLSLSYLGQGSLRGAALLSGVARAALEDRDEVFHLRERKEERALPVALDLSRAIAKLLRLPGLARRCQRSNDTDAKVCAVSPCGAQRWESEKTEEREGEHRFALRADEKKLAALSDREAQKTTNSKRSERAEFVNFKATSSHSNCTSA